MNKIERAPFQVGPWILCPECQGPNVRVSSTSFDSYFRSGSVVCPDCRKGVDWWLAVLNATRRHFMLTEAFHVLGASTTLFTSPLRKETSTEIDFVSKGVPENAIILSVNYTGSGLMPIQVHSNVLRHDPLNKSVAVYGASHGRDVPDGSVDVSVTWIAPSPDDAALRQLVDAARAYDTGRYDALIVPANVAVESEVKIGIALWLTTFCGKERVKAFLADSATYSHQLNVLLPIACFTIGLAPLPDHVRGGLNQLRNLRNDVAHEGAPSTPPSRDTAAELLTAAVFGFHYSRLFYTETQRARSRGGRLHALVEHSGEHN